MDIVSLFWKNRAKRHEEIKNRLIELKSKRNYLNILNKPMHIRNRYDREIKKLEKKLSRIGG